MRFSSNDDVTRARGTVTAEVSSFIYAAGSFFIAVGYAVVLRQLIVLADRLLSAAI